MEQIEYEDIYKGKPRKLVILNPLGGTTYRVFCEASFVGTITVTENEGSFEWQSDYNLLKPVVKKIGHFIEELQD